MKNYKNFILNYYSKRGIKNVQVMPALVSNKLESSSALVQPIHNEEDLNVIKEEMSICKKCVLFECRHNVVFGEGNPKTELMFVGEGPGEDEDTTGRPFVGKAGELLDKIIVAMGLSRESIYIANVVKCRPPGNRNPSDEEITACATYLKRQIFAIRPKVIVSLGAIASSFFSGSKIKISSIRGSFFEWNNIKIMPTFHPSYLLRNPSDKKLVWHDVQKVMEYLDYNKK